MSIQKEFYDQIIKELTSDSRVEEGNKSYSFKRVSSAESSIQGHYMVSRLYAGKSGMDKKEELIVSVGLAFCEQIFMCARSRNKLVLDSKSKVIYV